MCTSLTRIYAKLFSIEEIRDCTVLQWLLGVSLFVFSLTFHDWMPLLTVSRENAVEGEHLCWPYFPSCGDWYFLSALPFGYSQNMFYMLLLVIMLAVAGAIWKKKWSVAHLGLLLLWLWEFSFIFILNIGKRGNYDYYQIILTAILLFLPHKLSFLRISFCYLYFLSASIKIHEGWILGTYFSSLKLGMPIFPRETIPLFTNIVIFMEMVGTWFLLSRRVVLQRAALAFFIFFHLYSGILVWYRYPATILPYLLILFGSAKSYVQVPLGRKSLPGWFLLLLLSVGQSLSFLIPHDAKLTFEGMNYGFYMFDSNHQCVSAEKLIYHDGQSRIVNKELASSRSRCDPYYRLFKLWQICKKDKSLARIEWEFMHSINGGPFYLIVKEPNACELEYDAFRHNEWIKTPEKGAIKLGYPVQNLYY